MTSTATRVPATEHGVVCAKCSGWEDGRKVQVRHASVSAVKLCQLQDTVVTVGHLGHENVVKITGELPPVPGAPVPTPADMLAEAERAAERVAANVTAEVSEAERVVPAGRYALEGSDGKIKFYVVDHGRKGTRWEGRIFVSAQASDELHPVRNQAQRVGILAAILVDPATASARYGRELGVCGVCGRTLTDEESRARGIGPVCAEKF